MNTSCPSKGELGQLLAGSLCETQEVESAQHLDRCECCQTQLEELATAGTKLSQLVGQLHEAQLEGVWDQEMRPVRNVLSRTRLKMRTFGIEIASILETGYVLMRLSARKQLGA